MSACLLGIWHVWHFQPCLHAGKGPAVSPLGINCPGVTSLPMDLPKMRVPNLPRHHCPLPPPNRRGFNLPKMHKPAKNAQTCQNTAGGTCQKCSRPAKNAQTCQKCTGHLPKHAQTCKTWQGLSAVVPLPSLQAGHLQGPLSAQPACQLLAAYLLVIIKKNQVLLCHTSPAPLHCRSNNLIAAVNNVSALRVSPVCFAKCSDWLDSRMASAT